MELQLSGKSVIITGGTRGIGLACAEGFAAEGCKVTIVGRDRAVADDAAEQLKRRGAHAVDAIQLDLAVPEQLKQLAPHLCSTDILVNCAGAIPGGGLTSMDEATWRRAWDLKVFGYINTTRIALDAMMARKAGVIVNVIGIAGASPRYDYICGSTGNAALISFTKAAGAEAARHGARVVGINPGPTQTDRLLTLYRARAKARFGDEDRWQEFFTHLPFGRATEAQEIANLVVFAASPRASYLSGLVIDADGGAMYTDPA